MKFPNIRYYNQDFVDIYNRCWYWLKDSIQEGQEGEVDLFDTSLSTFFLCYAFGEDVTTPLLNRFYSQQREDGSIPFYLDAKTNEPSEPREGHATLLPSFLGWTEFNLFQKQGDKKRLAQVYPVLEKHFFWLRETYYDEEMGLYKTPAPLLGEIGQGRDKAVYLADFNAQQALSVYHMSLLADLQNNREVGFQLKQLFFSLKMKINDTMWSDELETYCDLDESGALIPRRYLGAYWVMLAKIPNLDRAEEMIHHLKDENIFGTKHPFPSLAVNDPDFDPDGNGYLGSVFPYLNFIVIKALEKYSAKEFARECVMMHLYALVDIYLAKIDGKSQLWEAYHPSEMRKASVEGFHRENRYFHLSQVALSTIALMIENVVGLEMNLPRKTVLCYIPTMELMGIENLSLRRNKISILTNNTSRGWEIRLESEKLYYFTLEIVDENKYKTLPIPSGNCSILIDKL